VTCGGCDNKQEGVRLLKEEIGLMNDLADAIEKNTPEGDRESVRIARELGRVRAALKELRLSESTREELGKKYAPVRMVSQVRIMEAERKRQNPPRDPKARNPFDAWKRPQE